MIRIRKIVALIIASFFVLSALSSSLVTAADKPSNNLPKVAIIIDDIGYNMPQGMKAAQFPAPLTLAVLPFGPNSRTLAKMGHQRGKEIMLHAPMSTIHPQPLDKGGLTESMSHGSFIDTLRNNIQAIPYISGINNHMGSALTQHQQSMNWLMAELKQHGLFFIDSRTSAGSVAWSIAQDHAIPSRSRDVFLDHERTPEAVAKQYQLLLKIAQKEGTAIAIGHPNSITMNFLEAQAGQFEEQGIQLVSVSELLPQSDTTPLPLPLPDPLFTPRDLKQAKSVYIPEDHTPPEQIIY